MRHRMPFRGGGEVTIPRLLRLLIILPIVCIHPAAAQVVLNEIMYAPAGAEPEWTELYNAGASAVDLSGWTLGDESGAETAILPATIPPRGFLVVTRDTLRLAAARFIRSPLMEIPLPLLNNGGDALILRNGPGKKVDSVRFNASWGGEAGGSIERRSPSDPGSRAASWSPSTDPDGATPGRTNSITAVELDLAIGPAGFDRAGLHAWAVVENRGRGRSSPAEVFLYRDANGDGAGAPEEELARQTMPALDAGGSITVQLRWTRELAELGESGVIEVRMEGDERPGNDRAEFIAQAPLLDTGIVINEIMFDPLPLDPEAGAEYVELFNRNDREVLIAGWKIYDATRKAQAGIPAGAPPILPGRCCVIACDSGIYRRFPHLADSANVLVIGIGSFSLNSDGDDVLLRNNAGSVVDSVRYRDDWHLRELGETKGLALERISPGGPSCDPRNWSTSAGRGGGTPGAVNSIAIPPGRSDAALAPDPPVLSPDGDGFEDFTRLSYHLPSRTARIIADVYDRWGRRLRRIASNEPAGATGELIWDGRDGDGLPLAPGVYIIRIEAYDEGGGGLSSVQGTVVVAKRL